MPDFPDPHLHIDGGTGYAYATNDGETNVQLQTSPDLATWTPQSDALPKLPSWADVGYTWAPHVYRFGDTRVLYYAGAKAGSDIECIGVATSPSPSGPFEPVGDKPLVCDEKLGGAIDPSVHEEDGKFWLVWKSDGDSDGQQTAIWSQPLTSDGTAFESGSSATKLLEPTHSWQDGIVEAPVLHDLDGQLFLLYSGNWFNTADYAIGYATCDSPSGPCTDRSTSPLVSSGADAAGPGGQSVFVGPDGSWWLGYHAWKPGTVGSAPGAVRSMHLDPMTVDGTTIYTDAPTTGGTLP